MGIIILAGGVVAVVAIWRTGSPFPELTDTRDTPPRGPSCATCGHSEHRGRCSERVSASGDIYDGGGDWVGYRNETYCNCGQYRTKPWPPCTICGHSRGEHYMLLKCRHVKGSSNESACACRSYRAEPGPKPSYYLDELRTADRRCPFPADEHGVRTHRCLTCVLLDGRCRYDRP
ncbi:hypothetical protein OHA37_40620 (plasmid) [Streptomyces sp. NBC_00335]|uniref:hypothetical protein n=1 Tax=unclassified Streptomyces TaxID=2593676 RepID=UPI002256D2FD|nr:MULTISPECIES: hypothetical protein [unclassified Streptomyces]MCX5410134.1 hypothetical protein [Streptomyces sp. NBC_00086]